MRIVELQYIPPRTLNYMIPILGGEKPEENDPGDTDSNGPDTPDSPDQGGSGGADS